MICMKIAEMTIKMKKDRALSGLLFWSSTGSWNFWNEMFKSYTYVSIVDSISVNNPCPEYCNPVFPRNINCSKIQCVFLLYHRGNLKGPKCMSNFVVVLTFLKEHIRTNNNTIMPSRTCTSKLTEIRLNVC